MADRGLIIFYEAEAATVRDYQPAVYIRYATGVRHFIQKAFENTRAEFTDDTDRAAAQLVIAYHDYDLKFGFVKTTQLLEDPSFYSLGDEGVFLVHCHRDYWRVVRYDYPEFEINESDEDIPTITEYLLLRPDAQVSQTSPLGGV